MMINSSGRLYRSGHSFVMISDDNTYEWNCDVVFQPHMQMGYWFWIGSTLTAWRTCFLTLLVWAVPKRQPGAPAVFDFFLTFLVCDEESDYQALTIDGGDHRNPANFIIRRFANIGTLEHTINRQALLDQTRMSTDPLTVLSLHSCTHRFPSVRLYQSHPAEAPLTQ